MVAREARSRLVVKVTSFFSFIGISAFSSLAAAHDANRQDTAMASIPTYNIFFIKTVKSKKTVKQ
jgi:hypothetical protein